MHMRIDQARQQRFSLQVDQFRLLSLGLQNLLVGANSQNTAHSDSERLMDREVLVHRDNLAMVENQVSLGSIAWLRCPGESVSMEAARRPKRGMERDNVDQQPADSVYH